MPKPITLRNQWVDIDLQDTGATLNTGFLELYTAFRRRLPFDWMGFDKLSEAYLANSGSPQEDDAYFNNFGSMWMELATAGEYRKSCALWEDRVALAERCETQNPRGQIHKGTPYYFLGATHILYRDFYHGFLAMHKALDEDIATHGGAAATSPARSFVGLDFRYQDQFARPWVEELARYLDSKLAVYRKQWSCALQLDDFRNRFLKNVDLTESVFSFVSNLALARDAEGSFDRQLLKSDFGRNSIGALLFQIALATDETIALKNPNPSAWQYARKLNYLASKISIAPDLKGYLDDVRRATAFPNPLSPVLRDVHSGTFNFSQAKRPTGKHVDLIVSYMVRNRGAHSLESIPLMTTSFRELLQRMLNSLFATVETLY